VNWIHKYSTNLGGLEVEGIGIRSRGGINEKIWSFVKLKGKE